MFPNSPREAGRKFIQDKPGFCARDGLTLAELLFSMGISAFLMYAVLCLLMNTVLYGRIGAEFLRELKSKARIISIIESRVANAGLGVPAGSAESAFRFSPSGESMLPGWTDALEILTKNDIPVSFQDLDGEAVARGERMRVLSTAAADLGVRLLPSGAEWGPRESRTVNITKTKSKIFNYQIISDDLSSWITALSLGRPLIITDCNAPESSGEGTAVLQNPLFVSMDWRGIDMFYSFRVSYFHAEDGSFYIRDSTKKDTTGAFPSVSLHKEPVVDGVLSACFELNKTTKTLSCWVLIRGSQGASGIPADWPAWAARPASHSGNLKVISHSWCLRNI